MARPAVFLDRDGTLNREGPGGFVARVEELELVPRAEEAIAALARLGMPLVVLTNQSGVARGRYGEAELARVHEALQRRLGGRIAAFFHCPHLPEAKGHPYGTSCPCRKPSPGLLRQALEVLDLAPEGSFLVGDSARDLQVAAGTPLVTVLLQTGKPWQEQLDLLQRSGQPPHRVAADLLEAARWISSRSCAPP